MECHDKLEQRTGGDCYALRLGRGNPYHLRDMIQGRLKILFPKRDIPVRLTLRRKGGSRRGSTYREDVAIATILLNPPASRKSEEQLRRGNMK